MIITLIMAYYNVAVFVNGPRNSRYKIETSNSLVSFQIIQFHSFKFNLTYFYIV